MQRAIATKNLEATVAFYAADATPLPVAEPIVTGVDAIREEWRHVFAIPGFQNKAELTKVDVSENGNMGYTQGTYATDLDVAIGQTSVEHGKWVSIWKKQPGGAWKIVVDIYNTDEPPPQHL